MRRLIKHCLLPLFPAALAAHSPDQQHVLYAASLCPLEPFGTWQLAGTCPLTEPKETTSNETVPASLPQDSFQWIRGDVCHEIPGGSDFAYCSYTLPSFNNGLGISIVTSTDLFEKLSQLSVLQPPETSTTAHSAPPPPSYRDVPIPGKGIGLVAERPIQTTEIFMTRTPAIMLDDTAFNRLGMARLMDLLAQAADQLPEAHRLEYLNLTTHVEVESHAERAYHIFMRNNFQTPVEGVEVFHSAFTQVSRLNHACRPNSEYFFDDATLSHNVFAARDISPGEELTVTYSDPVQTHATRQVYLHQHWGFQCTCTLCTAPTATIQASDTRIAEIRALWADLDDYSPESGKGTPEKAERLIELYEQEELFTRMVEAYYRAAVEWNGVGDAEKARRFAERSVEAGRVMESGIRPFLGNMRALAANPEGHWTWRFRVRG